MGQEKIKRFNGDIVLEQNMLLRPMVDDNKGNLFMEGNTTNISGRLYYRFHRQYSILGEMSAYYNNAYRKLDKSYVNYFNEIENLNDYYIKDISTRSSIPFSVNFFIGFAYHKYVKNWEVRPVVGIGAEYMNCSSLSYTLKEKGTNTSYDVNYIWMKKGENDCFIAGFLTGEINTVYHPKNKCYGWIFGLSFRHYLSRVEFKRELLDSYTKEPIDCEQMKGRKSNMLGIKVGITF